MSIHAAKETLILKHLRLARIPACKDPRHGAACGCNHASHIDGWDLRQPVFEKSLERGERLIQFVSNPSASNPTFETGNYFTWAGGDGMGAVGVGSGLPGGRGTSSRSRGRGLRCSAQRRGSQGRRA